MKEIKAFIRSDKAEQVLEALEQLGISDITLIDVMGVGALADPHNAKYSVKCVEKYSRISKLEVVCSDQQVSQILDVIRKTAYTGLKGDGIIFVTPVETAVKIRTGATGDAALG